MFKYSIKFDLQKVKSENKPIRVRICYLGNRVDIPLGFTWVETFWDKTKQRPYKNTQNNHDISANLALQVISANETYIHDIFANFALKNKVPTPEDIKACFYEKTGKINTKIDKTLYDYFNDYIEHEDKRNGWAGWTKKKYITVRNRINDFDKKLSPETITEKKLYDFMEFLYERDYRNVTVARFISIIKSVLKFCASNNRYYGNLHNTFSPRFKGLDNNHKEVIFLELDELMSLYNCKLVIPTLEYVRDVFCFCCFTGLRYSDVAKLTKDDIKQDYINFVTQKTNDNLKIYLNKFSRSILEKYQNKHFKNNLVFPIISNQKMNEYLKGIGQIAGITTPQKIVYFRKNKRIEEVYPKYKLLTTHCARRTFVCQSLALGTPVEVIMTNTGHKDYGTFKVYAKIIDEKKRLEMSKFDKL